MQKQTSSGMPLLSICIPAYNAEQFIAETLKSALAQTYTPIEIIVSDDRSQDKTVDIVSKYIIQGVKLVKQPQNLGMFGNFNAAIRASSGKYVVKLDADDILHPEYCTQMVQALENNPKIVFAHCACRLIDADGNFLGYERSIHGSFVRTGEEEWVRYTLGPRAVNIVTIRRNTFNEIGGYDERYRYSGDWALHRALLLRGSVFYNDNVLASYRVHSVGKKGVKLLQANEHLMHLEDIARDWPDSVPHKDRVLQKARRYHARSAAISAAYTNDPERAAILSILPHYSGGIAPKFLGTITQLGGSGMVRGYYNAKGSARQAVKMRLKRSS
jgi:glycosyltransferase involved in cell wall biosynthesis